MCKRFQSNIRFYTLLNLEFILLKDNTIFFKFYLSELSACLALTENCQNRFLVFVGILPDVLRLLYRQYKAGR